jgi:signal transduction histidine kinase
MEFTTKIEGGKNFNIYIKCNAERDHNNKVVKASGIIQDTTNRKKEANLLNSILNSSTDDIYVVDNNYKLLLFNKNAELSVQKIFGKKLKVGQDILKIVGAREKGNLQASILKVFNGEKTTLESHYELENNINIYMRADMYPIIEENGSIEKIVINANDITNEKRFQDDLIKLEIEKERAVNRSVIEALEEERLSLGIELHDNVNQILGMSKLQLEYASNTPNPQAIIKKTTAYIQEAIAEIRRVTYNLSPPNLNDIGLESSIRVLIEKMDLRRSYEVNLTFNFIENRIDTSSQLAIYRIVQEAMNNIIKHAEANAINISIIDDVKEVTIVIKDNGKGFDTQNTNYMGIGIKNMVFRANALDGKLNIESKEGEGTSFTIKAPIPHAPVTSEENRLQKKLESAGSNNNN